MSAITSGMNKQYADSSKLAARARLHQEFSVGEQWFPWVMDRLPLRAGDRVLDIGCGPAWFWAASQGHFPAGIHLTLADQSEGMVKEATERCAPLGFASVTGRQADVTALPFADGSFDVVIAMHMLYHVADQEKAVAEMHRVLKQGGSLAATNNGADNLRQLTPSPPRWAVRRSILLPWHSATSAPMRCSRVSSATSTTRCIRAACTSPTPK